MSRVYHDSGSLLSETVNGLTLSNQHDSLLRRTNLTLNPALPTLDHGYAYDHAGRLGSVTDRLRSSWLG